MPDLPECRACNAGDLVPFSDIAAHRSDINFQGWICTNPECGFNLKIRNGEIRLNEPIYDGQERARGLDPDDTDH